MQQPSEASDVRAILGALREVSIRSDLAKLPAMLSDLLDKVARLPADDRWEFLAKAMFWAGSENVKGLLPQSIVTAIASPRVSSDRHDSSGLPEVLRPKFDAALVLVTPTELDAACRLLGIKETQPHDYGYAESYWPISLRTNAGDEIRVLVTAFVFQRNVPAAILTERLLARFDVGLCVLAGIAAGVKGHTKLGDVVVSDAVMDYEGARLELDKSEVDAAGDGATGVKRTVQLLRELQLPLTTDMSRAVGMFRLSAARARKSIVAKYDLPQLNKWRFKLHKAVILSGDKLIADGSLVDKRFSRHERIRAAAMEDSGFAQACRMRRPEQPWVVFRGISDFGDGRKKRLEEMQAPAACSAVHAAMEFVRNAPPRLYKLNEKTLR